jgi:putative addiction module killer protein
VEPQPRDIELYETEDGKVPYQKWFEELQDLKAKGQIDTRLARVRLGNLGDYDSVGDGVYELRFDIGPGYRLYFAQLGKMVILLLWGGDKSSQGADIKKAKEYWADYQRRES